MEEKIISESKNWFSNSKLFESGKKGIVKRIVFLILTLAVFWIELDGWYGGDWCVVLASVLLLAGVVFGFVPFILYVLFYSIKVTVTDKRVFGKAFLGVQVDLPIDSISVVGLSPLKGLTVASSSGRIFFFGITNRNEIYQAISDLLIKRQSTNNQDNNMGASSISDLATLKKYLDSGIITQEEFDAKKKQILGL